MTRGRPLSQSHSLVPMDLLGPRRHDKLPRAKKNDDVDEDTIDCHEEGSNMMILGFVIRGDNSRVIGQYGG